MNLQQIRELLETYAPRDCSVHVTGVSCSRDAGFSLGTIGAPAFGIPLVDLTSEVLHQWGVRSFYCIDLTLSAGPGSEILGQILVPEKDWNGKAVVLGNGGPAMALSLENELCCLYEPYAVIHCNLGTADLDAGIYSSAGMIDHGWRATHLMTIVGKDIVELICGKPITRTFFVGQSTGGQQAIAAATLCPEDYDGIVAMAPAITRSGLHAFFTWCAQQLVREDETPKFTPEEISQVHEIVLDYHREKGYGAPGDEFVSVLFTEEERQEILRKMEDSGRFSQEQMDALRAVYFGPVNPATGEKIYSGFSFGAECTASGLLAHMIPDVHFVTQWLSAWVAGVPTQEFFAGGYHRFDFSSVMESPAMRRVMTDMDADSGDLAAFKAHGGKLLVIQGIVDEFIPPENTIDWYERVAARQGSPEAAQEFCRLYLVPGFCHTFNPGGINWVSDLYRLEDQYAYYIKTSGGNTGAGLLHTIDSWVCEGIAPDSLMGSDFDVQEDGSVRIARQRPLYPYPDQTEYAGGDPSLPASFRRKKGEPGRYVRPRTGRYEEMKAVN